MMEPRLRSPIATSFAWLLGDPHGARLSAIARPRPWLECNQPQPADKMRGDDKTVEKQALRFNQAWQKAPPQRGTAPARRRIKGHCSALCTARRAGYMTAQAAKCRFEAYRGRE
jgi:hypothetical protein